MSFTTNAGLVKSLRHNCGASWERFFETYAPLIRLHGQDCGIDENSLDDLVQEVMLSVFSNHTTFEYSPDKGKFRNYLRFIIRARANDMLRAKYKHAQALGLPVNEACLDNCYHAEWEEHMQQESLKRLKEAASPRHYQIFHMLDVQCRKVKDVARFFRMSEASVYSIRSRMEIKLRQIAQDMEKCP